RSSVPVSKGLRFTSRMVRGLQRTFPRLYAKVAKHEGRKWGDSSIPWTPVKKPVTESRVALITTGGIILKTQEPFNLNDSKGDSSYREIPGDASGEDLVVSHLFYDHTEVEVDTEIMFPLQALHTLQAKGEIGEVVRRHFSFNGGISDPTLLIERHAPDVAQQLVADQEDLALLTPA